MTAFSIEHHRLGKFDTVRLTDRESGAFLTIIPDQAGLINEYVICDKDGGLHSIIDGYSSVEEILEKHAEVFKSAKLSPFPNRIKDGVYTFNENRHHLKINFPRENNSIHGLVFDKPFKIDSEEDGVDYARLVLSYDYQGNELGYPYAYSIQLVYQLHRTHGLKITTIIKNAGDKSMPVGDGWHPYFKTGSNVDELEISFPSKLMYKVDGHMIPTGEKVAYDTFITLRKVAGYQFDSCFKLSSANGKAVIRVEDTQRDVCFTIWQETGENKYNYLQIYTPPGRKSIAFEPMTCPPDVFNNKIDLITLVPGAEVSISWGIST